MSEWSSERWLEGWCDLATYRPSDFLMFAPRAYWRLFELQNEAWWPLPLLLPGLGLAAMVWWSRGGLSSAIAQRCMTVALAATSAFAAWSFVMERYVSINWAASGLAAMLGVLVLLLLALAAYGRMLQATHGPRRHAAIALGLWAFVGHPLLAPLTGRPLAQAEVFGLAPDPTVIAVLAWLVQGALQGGGSTWRRWPRRAAWTVALVHCAASAATLATMNEALAPLAAAVVAVLAARRRGRP